MLHSGRGLSVWKEPCGLHQASAKRSQSNDQLGHGLCSQLGKRQDMWKKKAAQVLKNIQICCVRLAGCVSSEGQDSPLIWGDELQPWVGLWRVPQPVWATGTWPGSKQRHQPSTILGSGIYSSCFSRKFRGFGIHKVFVLGWELTHSTEHIHLIFSMFVMQYP